MAILGELAVNLLARTGKFDKGMDRSRKKLDNFKKSTNVAAVALKSFGALFTGFAVVGFVNQQRAMIDSLAKAARRLNLSTEALGAYQFAAKLSGLETSQLNTALERMRDTLGAAVLGEAGAIRAFEALNLSAAELSKAADPLMQIQEALSRIGDQNKKIAIVRDIFGRSGAQVLNLFENNLRKVREEFERTGQAFTSDEAKRIEEFNDSLTRLAEISKGVGRRLLIDITDPAINAIKGLQIILEEAGLIKPRPTALEQVQALKLRQGQPLQRPQQNRRGFFESTSEAIGRAFAIGELPPHELKELLTGERQIF